MPKQSDESTKRKLESEVGRLQGELEVCNNAVPKSQSIKEIQQYVDEKPEWFSSSPPDSNQWHSPAHPKSCCSVM